MNLVIMQCKKT